MATVTVGRHPELDADKALELFRKQFQGKYKVQKTHLLLGRDFVVIKSGWTGVSVKVKQESSGTTFVFVAFMPSVLKRVLFGGLLSILFLRGRWRAMEKEIASFLQNAPELR